MRCLAMLALAILGIAHARISFPHSEVLQYSDVSVTNKANFNCKNTCRVYIDFSPSYRKDDKLMITQNGLEILTFTSISSGTDNFNASGVEIPTGDYVLENISGVNPAFVFYVVDSTAPNYGAPVYTPDDTHSVSINGQSRYATILSSFDSIEFYNFKGAFPEGYPRIFAAGFDSADEAQCNHVFQARSQNNAEKSWPNIAAAVLTVDFGFVGAHSVSAVAWSADDHDKRSGGSTVYTSPGYVGCKSSKGQSYESRVAGNGVADKFTLATESLDVNAVYNGISAAESIKLSVNNEKVSLDGSNSYSAHYTKISNGKFAVELSWSGKTPDSEFAIQLDFGTAPSTKTARAFAPRPVSRRH